MSSGLIDSKVAVPDEIVDAYTALTGVYADGEGYSDWMFSDFVMREVTPSMTHALDVGCGVGRLAMMLAGQIPNVVGLDITPAMIKVAQERAASAHRPIEFIVADTQTWQYPQKFDLITAMYSLGYVNRSATLRKLFDMLNPGGKLLVLDGLTVPGKHPILDMVGEFAGYYGFRLRHGMGLNLRTLMRNISRVGDLYGHAAWQVCEKWHDSHAVTPQDYRKLVNDAVPGAQVHMVTPRTGFVVGAKQ